LIILFKLLIEFVFLLLIRQESQLRFVSYKWNRISRSYEKQRRKTQERRLGWWTSSIGSSWGDSRQSKLTNRWDFEGHQAGSACGVRRE